MKTLKLSEQALPELSAAVAVPAYDRQALSAGIIHIGVGNFHRAHQAYYLDRLFAEGIDLDWAIIGAGIKPYDSNMRDRLAQQDWLTTLVELDPDQLSAKVIGSMIDFLPVDAGGLITALSDAQIRIVSLTVTEGGYFVDAKTNGFDRHHPEIQADVNNPDSPQTVFGILLAALVARRAAGVAPFTVMSCDNLPENGHVTRQALLGLAELIDPELSGWIAEHVAFPNGMVDCIVPATTNREIKLVEEEFGVIDQAPVTSESFHQWVLEDHFPNGRPALEKVGVQFVDDVRPYELMKLRILNGGHAIIAYAAGLLDIVYAHEAMENPLISAFLEKVEREEILPIVPPVPDTSLEDYLDLIRTRFANPRIGDRIQRLCLDGSNRQPKFIIPSIADHLQQDNIPTGLVLESALWCRYCQGVTDGGNTIAPNDPNWERLQEYAARAAKDPGVWLDMHDIYGDLGQNTALRGRFTELLNHIATHGVKASLEAYLNQSV
ncbi:MAG: mannitol dehydrogenase family protein [Thiolinea sp.]